MSEALGEYSIADLTLEGASIKAQVAESITSAVVTRTTDGAPTLVLQLHDPRLEILGSGIFSGRVAVALPPYSFVLAQVGFESSVLTCTFEEVSVSAMRLVDSPRKVEAGSMSRKEFVRQLVTEVPGLTFTAPPYDAGPIKEELARGTVADTEKGVEAEKEDTWTAIGRLADEVQWVRFIRGPREVVYADEAWLISGPPIFTVRRADEGVIDATFDYDTVQATATATLRVFAELWQVPPGAHVAMGPEYGPAAGDKWFVQEIERDLFSKQASITLLQPQPSLPEPEAASEGGDVVEGDWSILPTGDGGLSDNGWQWPIFGGSSKITSGFGMRNGRMHEGIDIGVKKGTFVFAARGGTVIFAGDSGSGYGNLITIQGKQYQTRYAHLAHIGVEKGMHVEGGEAIGVSGGVPGDPGAGDATGPHLHFEIRPGVGTRPAPVNPLDYLPKEG